MKTDRELLELAAKAAGYFEDIFFDDGFDYPYWKNGCNQWNPLKDDGDALRLAVKLKIHLQHYDDGVDATYCDFLESVDIAYGNDADAATRRAIVLVAAYVGKKMEGLK